MDGKDIDKQSDPVEYGPPAAKSHCRRAAKHVSFSLIYPNGQGCVVTGSVIVGYLVLFDTKATSRMERGDSAAGIGTTNSQAVGPPRETCPYYKLGESALNEPIHVKRGEALKAPSRQPQEIDWD
jgi:hypothetical protein